MPVDRTQKVNWKLLWHRQVSGIAREFHVAVSAHRCPLAGPFKMHGSLPIRDSREMDLLVFHPRLDLQEAIGLSELDLPVRGIDSSGMGTVPFPEDPQLEIILLECLRNSIRHDKRSARGGRYPTALFAQLEEHQCRT